MHPCPWPDVGGVSTPVLGQMWVESGNARRSVTNIRNCSNNIFYSDGNHSVGKYISHVDSTYSSLFMDSVWRDVFEKPDSKAGL